MLPRNPDTDAFWQAFRRYAALDHDDYVVGSFGDSPEMATEFAELVIAGIKRATASLARDYGEGREPIPKPGDFVLMLDGAGSRAQSRAGGSWVWPCSAPPPGKLSAGAGIMPCPAKLPVGREFGIWESPAGVGTETLWRPKSLAASRLARETKAGAVLQLCLYSELIGKIQGLPPQLSSDGVI